MEETKRKIIEVKNYIIEIKNSIQNFKNEILSLKNRVRKNEFETYNGISYLTVKYEILLSYCSILLIYFMVKLNPKMIKNSTEKQMIINRLNEQKLIMEKIKPIDERMDFTIKKLIRIASSEEQVINVDPIPLINFDNDIKDDEEQTFDDVDDQFEEEEDDDDDIDEFGKESFLDDKTEDVIFRRKRDREKEKLAEKLQNSDLVNELERMFNDQDKPEEQPFIGSEKYLNKNDEDDLNQMINFEENRMIRVKQFDKRFSNFEHQKKKNNFFTEINNIGKFGEIIKAKQLIDNNEEEENKKIMRKQFLYENDAKKFLDKQTKKKKVKVDVDDFSFNDHDDDNDFEEEEIIEDIQIKIPRLKSRFVEKKFEKNVGKKRKKKFKNNRKKKRRRRNK